MLEITTGAFEEGGEIPSRHTCDGENVSPPLHFAGAPQGTRSLALVVDDLQGGSTRATRRRARAATASARWATPALSANPGPI